MNYSVNISFDKHTKKYNTIFSPLPAIGIVTGLYNYKTEYSICFMWLVFEMTILIRNQSDL